MMKLKRSESVRIAAIVWSGCLLLCGYTLASYHGTILEIKKSSFHLSSLICASVLMWIAGAYSLYLVVGSFGSKGFPSHKAKLPTTTDVKYGLMAGFFRVLGLVAAVSLFAMPALLLLKLT